MRQITRIIGQLPIPDGWAAPLQYRLEMGRWPNLRNPERLNEHLCRAKLRADGPALARYVDKLAARRVAAAALGAGYLVPLVGGPWRRGSDVPVRHLPPCALKCTHASHAGLRLAGPLGDAWSLRGGRQVCALGDVGKVLDGWLAKDWYRVARERPYHYVVPRIIAEEWIDGAMDYKVMVFRGKARVIQRHGAAPQPSVEPSAVAAGDLDGLGPSNLGTDEDGQPAIDLYDSAGYALRAGKVGFRRFGPAQLDFGLCLRLCGAAVKVAAQVSPAQDYLRVDFLVSPPGRIYFGEITFYDSAGLRDFTPPGINMEMGAWLRPT